MARFRSHASIRTGKAEAIGDFETKGERRFMPPGAGELIDWVPVLDDAGKNYPPTGSRPNGE